MTVTKTKKCPDINKAERLVKLVAYVSGKMVVWYSMPYYEKKAKGDKITIAQGMLLRFKKYYPNFQHQPRFYDNEINKEIKL